MAASANPGVEQAQPEGLSGDVPTRRVKAVVAYDGTEYLGFQRQVQGPTVQGVLEEVLARIAGHGVRVLGAGRTDAGVHARGQVVAFDLAWRHGLADLRNAMNALLPRSVAVREVSWAPEGFHPRFDAVGRVYRYRVYNGSVRSPFEERYAWHVPEPLDVERMNLAATCLVGVHDFASFGQPTQGEVTVREVRQARWERQQGDVVAFTIEANAFLRGMVRSLVGTLVDVGLGRLEPSDVERILQARDRGAASATAPPQGLFLVEVRYPQRPASAGKFVGKESSGSEDICSQGFGD
ncbi:MAG: tRNA pseudouridine(38-40) synthase TruA [Anaerolineae bacterium]|nr:tRNA pseudouridine(38-40) synthase TruA [Anaerolineae bacterium]